MTLLRAGLAAAQPAGLPKVALLFITRAPMPLEPLWAVFLSAAATIAPAQPDTRSSAGAGPNASNASSSLFSVYIHPPPGYSYPNGSAFAGREIPERVMVRWRHSTEVSSFGYSSPMACWPCAWTGRQCSRREAGVTWFWEACPAATLTVPAATAGHATRCALCLPHCRPCPAPTQLLAELLLLRKALADPLNQRFVLLSDSCMPTWPPATAYWQLMVEEKSRLNTCTGWDIKYTSELAPNCAIQPGLARGLSWLEAGCCVACMSVRATSQAATSSVTWPARRAGPCMLEPDPGYRATSVSRLASPTPPPSPSPAACRRWKQGMAEFGVPRESFRKSSQWKSLVRKHAGRCMALGSYSTG